MRLTSILNYLADEFLNGLNVEIANIAMLNDGDEFIESNKPILLSIVNIEEDRTIRNQSLYTKTVENDTLVTKFVPNQEKYLVASILFSVYQKNKMNNTYLEGIDNLQEVILRFQENQLIFVNKEDDSDILTSAELSLLNDSNQKKYQQITFEMMSLGYDQLNQMWSYLGSRYMPSVLFKMKFISIQAYEPQNFGKVIKKIGVQLWENNPNNAVGILEETEPE
jgi:hypothetical protein